MFSTSKVKSSQKFIWPTEFAGLTQNREKKLIGTPNQLIRTKTFQKKSIFSILKVQRSQKLVQKLPDGIRTLYLKS
jgi:hypothetical protein